MTWHGSRLRGPAYHRARRVERLVSRVDAIAVCPSGTLLLACLDLGPSMAQVAEATGLGLDALSACVRHPRCRDYRGRVRVRLAALDPLGDAGQALLLALHAVLVARLGESLEVAAQCALEASGLGVDVEAVGGAWASPSERRGVRAGRGRAREGVAPLDRRTGRGA